jgi:transcriptional regulator with XRE-family HTH domain
VGYRGKLEAQEKARLLREEGRTLKDIAEMLGVSKSSVSLWVRDIDVEIRRRKPVRRRPHAQHLAKLTEIAECDERGSARLNALSDQAFLVAGVALYAGEGAKRDGRVMFANTDAEMVTFFCAWLRRFFVIDELRMRVRVYLHEGLDLDAAEAFWSNVTGIPREQFGAPYRAKADPTRRLNKHEHGCAYVGYSCSRTHREIMGLIRALLSSRAIPG